MARLCLLLLLLPCLPAMTEKAGSDQEPVLNFEQDVLAFLDRYCLFCHEGAEGEGGIDLAQAWTEEEARALPEIFWQAAWKVWDHAMPPPRRRKQPSEAERARFLAWVDAPSGLGFRPQAEAPVLRRMNAATYRRSIRDLLGIELPPSILAHLPPDEAGDGFDNIGAALTLSDDGLSRYLEAAEEIAALAVVDPEGDHQLKRWLGVELMADHHQGHEAALWSQGEARTYFRAPRSGRYLLRLGASGDQAGAEACRAALRVDQQTVGEGEIPTPRGEEHLLEAEVDLSAGEHVLAGAFLNDYYRPDLPDGEARDRNLYIAWLEIEGPLDPLTQTPFQVDLLARYPLARHYPGRAPGYDAMLEALLGHAWRRPPTREEMRRFARMTWDEEQWLPVIRMTLTAALTSPHFLFEETWEPEGRHAARSRPLSGHELATRLAFFLWGSLPDEALLEAASKDDWASDDDALRATVARMLADPRSHALAEDFATQCFRIRGLQEHGIDQELFPTADAELLAAMAAETMALFEDNLQAERDLRELLTADYAFLDRRMAEHYGLPWPAEAVGRLRFDLSATPRRGILGQAAILTATSMATRTSPARRGRWIMDNLLGAEPPPPPPDAGALDESPQAAAEAPLRERLAAHRDRPNCRSCHQLMDPLGFSLEHFDPLGRWRDRIGPFPVDAEGALPDGTPLHGLQDLVEVLAARDRFLPLMLKRLSSFALGRPMGPADRPFLQDLRDALDPEHPTLRAAIEAIVLSPSFRQRPMAPRVSAEALSSALEGQ